LLCRDTILKKQAKNFGSSPLVACVPEEEFQTGSDLLRLFKHLLRPLNKHSDEDLLMLENDGCSNMTISTNDRSQNILKHEMFKFWLIEDRITFKDVLIEWDKPLPGAFTSGQVNTPLQIAVDWSEYALEQYDAKQLEVITESLRGGYSAKKLRQEVVSLYSCLEAFLKEEPLGPEDMW
jgi:ubiquitin carboxyl-terminal hydrolase 4/11/15